MTCTDARLDFIDWVTGDYFLSYQRDRAGALQEGLRRAASFEKEERDIMSLALTNVANGAMSAGSLLGGGKIQLWCATAVTILLLFAADAGLWSVIPVGINLIITCRDYVICRNRANAYMQLSDQLKASIRLG